VKVNILNLQVDYDEVHFVAQQFFPVCNEIEMCKLLMNAPVSKRRLKTAGKCSGVNVAAILGDEGADPEGLVGAKRRLWGTAPTGEESGGGYAPAPTGEGSGRGLCPLLRKNFSTRNGVFWCILSGIFVRVLARKMLNFPPKVGFGGR